MRFELLGPVRFFGAKNEVEVGRRQERCLLCLLLLEAPRPVPADRLLELLWNGEPPTSGRSTLHTYVARLRQALAPHGVKLLTAGGGYRVDVAAETVDVHRFTAAMARAKRARGPQERLAALDVALALWRGPLLADVADDWLRHRLGAGLEEQRLAAHEARARALLDSGRSAEAADALTALAAEHPTREGFTEPLMVALYRSGRRSDALAAYRTLRRALVDDLGLEPPLRLRELHQRMLADDPRLDGPEPARAGRRFLPLDVPDFSGRQAELAWLDESTAPAASARTVLINSLTGIGGVGKTALAVHWAHRAAARYPDGQLYLNLRGYDARRPMRPLQALSQLLRMLGVDPARIPATLEEATALYRATTAELRLVVILDNAASADQVRPLLPGGPATLVVVTSRDRLTGLIARDGARRLTLSPLPTEDALRLLANILGADRVAAEEQASVSLVRAAGHLPLALRIAAANLADDPRQALAAYVPALTGGDRLDVLSVEDDPGTAVRTVFRYSYQALPGRRQRLFRLIGQIPGPDLTVATAAALADLSVDDAAAAVNALVDAHLLTEYLPGRYTMHDLIKAYAMEQSEPGESSAARERLGRHYLDHADAAARAVYPQLLRLPHPEAARFATDADALAWLDAERANLLAAVHRAAADNEPLAWKLTDMLRGYLSLRRHLPEWLAAARDALACAEAAGERDGRIMARFGLSHVLWWMGSRAEAVTILEPAEALAVHWPDARAAVLGNLGGIHGDAGNLREAARHLDAAIRVQTDIGTPSLSLGNNLTNLGAVCHELGRFSEATAHQRRAAALYGDINAQTSQAAAHVNLAETLRALGSPGEAVSLITAALPVLREAGDRYGVATALVYLARAHHDLGEPGTALDLARDGLAVAREAEASRPTAAALALLGLLERDPARQDEALALVGDARYTRTEILLARAATLTALDRPHEARTDYATAFELARAAGYEALEATASSC